MSISELANERAIRACVRRQSGDWTAADENELQTWLGAARENRAAFAAVERAWFIAGGVDRGKCSSSPRGRPVWHRAVVAAAAMFLLALMIPAWMAASRWWYGVSQTWIALRAQPRQITLRDGTKVVLDADSEVIVKLGVRERRVRLVRGEALFHVRHDPSRPFQVQAGPGRITDIGTRFEVESLGTFVRVAVLTGRVSVSTPRGKLLLAGGQSGGFDMGGALRPISAFDSSTVLWPEGQRHFESEPLSEVLAEFARYHRVTFTFTDPQLERLPVSGIFRLADLGLFLRTLSAAFPVQIHRDGPHRIDLESRTDTSTRHTVLKH